MLYYILQVTASTSAGSGPPAVSDLVLVPEASEYFYEPQMIYIHTC